MKINLKLEHGFTLIELLVVISVIGVLAGVVLFAVNPQGQIRRASDAQRKSDLRQIQSALEMYRADVGSYPDTSQLSACGGSLVNGTTTYLSKIPCDPLTHNAYSYTGIGSPATTYQIIACLQDTTDPQKDSSNVSPCVGGTTNWSYTVKNP